MSTHAAKLLIQTLWDTLIHLKTVVNNGVKRARTAYEDGWNAAVMDISHRWQRLTKWAATLSSPHQETLMYLLDSSVVEISMDGEDIVVLAHVGDVFSHTADNEEIELQVLPTVLDIFHRFGHDGLVAYVSHKRGQAPLGSYLTDNHTQALKHLLHFSLA